MAGWMKIVTPFFINKFKNKIINIHPSLLPAYKGGSAINDSILNGSKITGCSVHFVDEEVDSGSLIIQAALSCLLYTSPSPRDRTRSRMPSSA